MPKKVIFITIFIVIFQLSNGFTQARNFCGMSQNDLEKVRQNLIENKAYLKKYPNQAVSRSAVTYIPVKFHLVAKDDGSGKVDYNRILDQICLLNETFEAFDFQFYIAGGFSELNSTAVYEEHETARGELKMQQVQDRNSLNVWILGDAQLEQNTNGQTLGYYTPNFDWVVVEKDFTSGQGFTMIHEMGHFFGLLHPFHGWGDEGAAPYDASYEGKPAPTRSPFPASILTEFADGSNCEDAGDMVCDTPADYLYFEQMDNASCRYTRPMTDPKGERLQPDPTLIMGYFLDNCMDKFTPQQVDLMKADLKSSRRARVRSSYTPVYSAITASPILIAPINNDVTPNYNKVQLSWQATSNTKFYLVEIEVVPTFGPNSIRTITTNPNVVIENLAPDKRYFWRVRPFNEVFTCTAPSASGRFKTGVATSVSALTSINAWELYPNPINAQDGITLVVNAKAAFEATIKLFDITGQILYSKPNQLFSEGETKEQLPSFGLTPGMYFLQLENQEGVLNKKLIVQ